MDMVGPFPDCRDPSVCLGGWRGQVTSFGQAVMGLKFDKDSFIRLLASFHSFGYSHHKMYGGVAEYPPSLLLSKGLAGKTLGREEPIEPRTYIIIITLLKYRSDCRDKQVAVSRGWVSHLLHVRSFA
jgi:hypothetical protein